MMLWVVLVLCSTSSAAGVFLQWAAPFLSGGGYSSEAIAFAQSLLVINFTEKHSLQLIQHGDSYNQQFVENLRVEDSTMFAAFMRSYRTDLQKTTISVCHSEPGAWYTPLPMYHTQPCPSSNADFKIGRTMFETNIIPSGWVSRLESMDEIWVPTEAARHAFIKGGLAAEDKLVVVPEPVDTDFFSPQTKIVSKATQYQHLKAWKVSSGMPKMTEDTFVFLFVGKFEYRKGIQLLLKAFYEEFFSSLTSQEGDIEDVILCILTSAYHSTDDFVGEISRYLREENVLQTVSLDFFLSKLVVYSNLPQVHLPNLYRFSDVLVVPSRGEGWGRPHVEAMSCGTPIIATNWSGPTAYMNSENSFPLKHAEALVPARGWEGHFWAEPSLTDLKRLLRFTVSSPDVVRSKGIAARKAMLDDFSLKRIGLLLVNHFERIEASLARRRKKHVKDDL